MDDEASVWFASGQAQRPPHPADGSEQPVPVRTFRTVSRVRITHTLHMCRVESRKSSLWRFLLKNVFLPRYSPNALITLAYIMASPEYSKTQAIVCRKPSGEKRQWALEQVAISPPADGEVIVEIVASGICHTDFICGSAPDEDVPLGLPPYPRVLGHEGLICTPYEQFNAEMITDTCYNQALDM